VVALDNFDKLDKLAETFNHSKCDDVFTDLYKEASRLFKNRNRAKLRMSGYPDTNDADEIFDSALLRVTRKGVPKGFGKQLSVTLKNLRINFIKSESRRLRRVELAPKSDDDNDTLTLDIATDISAEEESFRTKKEADQLELIDFLTNDPRQVDHDTTLIVSQFRRYDSITALAKALGMHHEYVKRKIRRLSHLYDANRFGSHIEYLAV
jgi:DNA-directed RNA polymerase specialized sigma24 family protein